MEDLTKHQLILIVLLVTFVTSIATGIITFTLLSEAPVEVTQTINRVVEKTIEKVVTEPGKPDKIVTTVVVNEEDRVLEAIAKNEKSIVRLKTIGADGSEIFAGFGLIISVGGVMVTDLVNFNIASVYSILFHDGKVYSPHKFYIDEANGLVFIKVTVPKNENSKDIFSPSIFGNSDNLKIGQTMIAISGKDSNAVAIGRVRQLNFGEDKKIVTNILSDISISKNTPGSPAINLSGEVVGIEALSLEGDIKYSYIPINILKLATPKALEELDK